MRKGSPIQTCATCVSLVSAHFAAAIKNGFERTSGRSSEHQQQQAILFQKAGMLFDVSM
jgi:hypothetical protein